MANYLRRKPLDAVICPYCLNEAKLVTGAVIYPHRDDLAALRFWYCDPCKAYTGTHANSPRHAPKGGLANAELRAARRRAHTAFDPLWETGMMTRAEAYDWLAQALGQQRRPHIGFMNVEDCNRVVDAVVRFHVEMLRGAE